MDQKTVSFNNKEYSLDKYGFLHLAKQWDENFAEGMARMQGIPEGLTDEHWEFIKYLRDKFLADEAVPVMVAACIENNLSLDKLRTLFPAGYHKGACKIAGINYAYMIESDIWITYECPPPKKLEYKVTELGFLEEFEKWNREFAGWVVRNWELPEGLTERHWQIIDYLRDFYGNTLTIPHIFDVCKIMGISLVELRELFPKGYCRGACRAAGLPFLK